MAGLVPTIHVLAAKKKDVDARHDEMRGVAMRRVGVRR
jgi:hypothetical protein